MSRFGTMLAVMLLMVAFVQNGWSEPKTITTQKTKDVVIILKNDAGQFTKGKNSFVLEISSAKDKQPMDAGTVSLNTTMTMSGMAPMVAGASLTADRTPGRYMGTIEFADTGTRQVTVSWDGPAGKGSAKFSVPVR